MTRSPGGLLCSMGLGVALLLSGGPAALGQERAQRVTRTTKVVTHADGTTTTTVTEVRTVTQDGRTSTRTTTRSTGSGAAVSQTGPMEQGPVEQGRAAEQGPAEQGRAVERGSVEQGRPVGDDVRADPDAASSPAGPALHGARVVREALAAHNRERARAGASPLAWDEGLARLAQAWANHLCGDGRGARGLQHRPVRMGGPGENLWQGMATGGRIFAVDDAVRTWAAEGRFYDARRGGCRGGVCGHYTQLIWRATTHVGCGAAACPQGAFQSTVWVCNYSPAGNIIGERP